MKNPCTDIQRHKKPTGGCMLDEQAIFSQDDLKKERREDSIAALSGRIALRL
jgi:hypothetical protein